MAGDEGNHTMAGDKVAMDATPSAHVSAPASVSGTAMSDANMGSETNPTTYSGDGDSRVFARTGRSGRHQRGGRGGGRGGSWSRGGDKGWKKRDGGGGFGSKNKNPAAALDQREQVSSNRAAKRRKIVGDPDGDGNGNTYMSINFSKEEIAAEKRRPKRKVAVLFGYAGTGYHGLQINHKDKTIEGDMFAAFVAAGAISKVNADDPKKSSLVRCARTDKGVHAAGNVLSLKLITGEQSAQGEENQGAKLPEQSAQDEKNQGAKLPEQTTQDEKNQGAKLPEQSAQDEENQDALVERINAHLPEQIRIWDILRTNNSFSAYQACESRWYEYLLPSYALLPPHPQSYLGRKTAESATTALVQAEYLERLDDVAHFWDVVQTEDIQPILDALGPEDREQVLRILAAADELNNDENPPTESGEKVVTEHNHDAQPSPSDHVKHADEAGSAEANTATIEVAPAAGDDTPVVPPAAGDDDTTPVVPPAAGDDDTPAVPPTAGDDDTTPIIPDAGKTGEEKESGTERILSPVEKAVRDIKDCYVKAKRRYRTSSKRIERLQSALDRFIRTHNFHNYTIEKSFSDPSAFRNIKSFTVRPQPVVIGDTEWLSLKVHGQSFMMHQIRKMVAMALMIVRCGAPETLIDESYGERRISIPKAPSLGLMLERPMFTESNKKSIEYGRQPLIFAQYEDKIEAFKDKYIYKHMFAVEEKENAFHLFFHQVDNFRTKYFLWVTAGGFDAACQPAQRGIDKIPKALEAQLGDDTDGVVEGDSKTTKEL